MALDLHTKMKDKHLGQFLIKEAGNKELKVEVFILKCNCT